MTCPDFNDSPMQLQWKIQGNFTLRASVCYQSLLLMKTHNHCVMLLISHYLFCICTCTFIYTAYMQMTLPIHVNTLTLINYFHFPRFFEWHMVTIICHQRTTAPFSVLTNLIFISENCHQSMISSLNLLFRVDQNLVCNE